MIVLPSLSCFIGKFHNLLFLGGDPQYFADSRFAAQGFNQTIELHGHHAFFDGWRFDGFTGALLTIMFLDSFAVVQHFVDADTSFVAGVVTVVATVFMGIEQAG